MGIKRAVAFFVVLILAVALPVCALAADEPLSIDIEQIDVKMPQLKVYLNALGEADERIAEPSEDIEYSALLDGKSLEVQSAEDFESSGEGVATIFLIDISKSLRNDDFENIKQMILKYITQMGSNDRAAVVTFGEEVNVIRQFTASQSTLSADIENLKLTDVNTRFYDGVMKALTLARVSDENLPDRRMIFAVTDGSDDYPGGITKQEVLDNIKEHPVPIYSLGIYSGTLTDSKQESLNALGEFSRVSKGLYYQMGEASFNNVYQNIIEGIGSTLVVTLDCDDMKADGKNHELYLALETDTTKIDDNVTVLINNNMKDIVAPVVTDVKNGEETNTIEIYFSESVSGADDADNYLILDSEGVDIIPLQVTYLEGNGYCAVLFFGVDLDGKYDLTVSKVVDKADVPNTLETETFPVTIEKEKSFFENIIEKVDMTILIIIGCVLVAIIVLIILLIISKRKRKKAQMISDGERPQFENGVIPKTAPQTVPQTSPSKPVVPKGKLIRFAVLDKENNDKIIEKRIVKSLIIGRSQECDITFSDSEMSRKHCKITIEDGQLYANDMNATNTTIVNGVPIHERIRLSSGDVLLIGETELRVTWEDK